MSLWSRIKAFVHKRTAEVEAEQAEAEAVAVEPEEVQTPEEIEPEEPAEFDEPDDSGDTVTGFEEATDEQPTEPPEQEPEPDPQPEDFEQEPFEPPKFETEVDIPPPDLTGWQEGDQPDELPTIPDSLAQEYVKLSGTGATTVDNSMPHSITIASPEYHVGKVSMRTGGGGDVSIPLGTPFVVKCTQSAGDAGGPGSTCTFTYTCKTLGNATLNGGDANEVLKSRIPNTKYVKGTADAGGSAVIVANGDFVLLEVFTEYRSGAGVMFPIVLSQTGGAAGSAVAATTWTYTVTSAITGTELGTGVDVDSGNHKFVRQNLGQMSAATYGFASYDESDNLVIGWINEAEVKEACA